MMQMMLKLPSTATQIKGKVTKYRDQTIRGNSFSVLGPELYSVYQEQ